MMRLAKLNKGGEQVSAKGDFCPAVVIEKIKDEFISNTSCTYITDINECEAEKNPCKDDEFCVNNEGSFACNSKCCHLLVTI